MVLGISRSYIGGVVGHQGLSRVVSCGISASPTCYTFRGTAPTRGYAAASASINKKSPVTAKGTRKDAHQKVPPQPKTKASGQTHKGTSPAMEAAQHTVTADSATAKAVSSQGASKEFDPRKSLGDMNPEEQAEEIERLERTMAFSHLMPTIDQWGQEVAESLDVMIPHPHSAKSLIEDPKKAFTNVKENAQNWMKNAAALSTLMSEDAVPGRTFNAIGKWAQARAAFGMLATSSAKPDAALAPLRQMALESYEDLNKALATRNDKELRQLTTAGYQRHILGLCKSAKAKNPKARLFWQLHRTFEPVRVLSLRATPGYLGSTEPRFGNRLMVHALFKFDTEQSLEMYNERGVPLHTQAVGEPEWIRDTDKREEWRVPAQRRRVTEYLIMEKRMWVLGPWQFREQLW